MAYHFPNERRVIQRRRTPGAPFSGPERRVAERRSIELPAKRDPMDRTLLWVAVLTVLVVVDSACLGGTYRHQAVNWLNDLAAGVRDWSAHVWDWGH